MTASPNSPTQRMRTRKAGAFGTLASAFIFGGIVAAALRIAWNPTGRSYLEYVPIGALFAAFVWERAFVVRGANRTASVCDAAVVGLALLRVFVPPLPFVSGHALFATYAVVTAQHWPLRVIAILVSLQVAYVKLFVSNGWKSMLGGLLVAVAAAAIRRRGVRAAAGEQPPNAAERPERQILG